VLPGHGSATFVAEKIVYLLGFFHFLCTYSYVKGEYRQRNPHKTPFYKITRTYFQKFRSLYAEKYEQTYGYFREEVNRAVEKYRKCGILRYGFARIKCENRKCGNELLLAFSCHGRSLCPSCMQKQMLLQEVFLSEEVIRSVYHRHMVFVIPRRLRKNFFWHRESLNDLSRLAWGTALEFIRRTLGKNGIPGSVNSIETSGEYQDINPHIHMVVTDGLFDTKGTFHVMPNLDEGARIFLKSLWERNVARYCISKGYVTRDLMNKVLSWDYTGFSVFASTRIHNTKHNPVDVERMKQMLRYITKPAFSLEKIVYNENTEVVLYKGSYHKGKKRNFETFTPEDFIAAVTSHVPNYRQKYVNYYGWYSNKSRGLRQKTAEPENNYTGESINSPTASQRSYRKTWAMLIKKVWEADPLECPKCKSRMKIISVITDNLVIEKILRHKKLWKEEPVRGPPVIEAEFEEVVTVPETESCWSMEYAE